MSLKYHSSQINNLHPLFKINKIIFPQLIEKLNDIDIILNSYYFILFSSSIITLILIKCLYKSSPINEITIGIINVKL